MSEITAYNNLTVDDINQLAKRIFTQQHASAYVGKQIDDYDEVSKITIQL